MTVVIDTTTVDPNERFDYWVEGAHGIFYPMTFRRAGDDSLPFRGLVRQYLMGPVALTHVMTEPTTITRTHAEISAHDPESIQLVFHRRGSSVWSQRGLGTRVSAGEFVVFDTSIPSLIRSEQETELIVLEAPKALLGREGAWATRNAARTLPSELTRALLGPFFGALADGLALGEFRESNAAVGESVLDMMRAACRDPDDGGIDAPPSVRIVQLKRYIAEHIGDPALSPATIAAANFMSTRALQKVFQADGLTVTDWIRECRLAGARRDLRDPRFADVPIAEIARAWGLPNAGHFSRLFRAAFGVSPRDARRA